MALPMTMKQEAEARHAWRNEKAFEVMRELISRNDFHFTDADTVTTMSVMMTDSLIEKLSKPQ